MSDSTTNLDTISASQAAKETTANRLFDSLSPASLYGRRASTTTGLTWGYYGGKFRREDGTIASVANGTVTLTNNATNYLYANGDGTVTKVTSAPSGWPGPLSFGSPGEDAIALYQIVVSGGAVTSYTDYRTTDYGRSASDAGGNVVGPASSVSGNLASFNGTTGKLLQDSGLSVADAKRMEIQVACSDETTALTTGTAKVTFRMPRAMTLTAIRASLSTAQTSGSIFTVDINEGGVSILSTKLTIDNGEKTSTTAATPPVISDTALADDAEITIDVDQIGDGTAKGLKVTLIGTRA